MILSSCSLCVKNNANPHSLFSGILLADYLVIRKRKLRLNELYIGNSSSHYWYNAGFNWRAFVAFFGGVWPLLRESPSRSYYFKNFAFCYCFKYYF